jgi:hypothetical protein
MSKRAQKITVAVLLVPLVYGLLGLLAFDSRTPAKSRLVEFTSSGKQAVVGPVPRPWAQSLCPPNGSGFLWSKDYTGHEWLYVVYRPLIAIWARAKHYELHPD